MFVLFGTKYSNGFPFRIRFLHTNILRHGRLFLRESKGGIVSHPHLLLFRHIECNLHRIYIRHSQGCIHIHSIYVLHLHQE